MRKKSAKQSDLGIITGSSSAEQIRREDFFSLYQASPIPENETLSNLGLFLNRQTLSRIIFMQELYKKIIDVHGIVIEFGTRWGQNMALFESFRGIYEPFNYNRKIVGFDSFGGFPSISPKDGKLVKSGDYAVVKNYEKYLEKILSYHEAESPIPHKKKFEIIKGDATKTIDQYLAAHPETIIALAYFDFDIYHPTKKCLQAIKPKLTKGSIVAFDELNCPEFPGETVAFDEVFGIEKHAVKRSPLNPLCSYIIM